VRARNHAAIAKVAAMLPANANEADLAAQSIAASAQADDIMRLIRENAHDIKLVARLNAQYMSMGRLSLSTHKHLIQVQALRQKREAIEATATQDARTRHIVEQSMLRVADPEFERLQASPRTAREEVPRTAREEVPRTAREEVPRTAREEVPRTVREEVPPAAPAAAPEAAPAPAMRIIAENVSQNKTISHGMAFETPMSDPAWDQEAEQRDLRAHIRETQRQIRLAMQELSANGRERPGRTGLVDQAGGMAAL
jgi:hypothetical protein